MVNWLLKLTGTWLLSSRVGICFILLGILMLVKVKYNVPKWVGQGLIKFGGQSFKDAVASLALRAGVYYPESTVVDAAPTPSTTTGE